MPQKLTDKRHPDYKTEIRGYYERVLSCKICGRDTNLIFQSEGHPAVVVCSARCRDKTYMHKKGRNHGK